MVRVRSPRTGLAHAQRDRQSPCSRPAAVPSRERSIAVVDRLLAGSGRNLSPDEAERARPSRLRHGAGSSPRRCSRRSARSEQVAVSPGVVARPSRRASPDAVVVLPAPATATGSARALQAPSGTPTDQETAPEQHPLRPEGVVDSARRPERDGTQVEHRPSQRVAEEGSVRGLRRRRRCGLGRWRERRKVHEEPVELGSHLGPIGRLHPLLQLCVVQATLGEVGAEPVHDCLTLGIGRADVSGPGHLRRRRRPRSSVHPLQYPTLLARATGPQRRADGRARPVASPVVVARTWDAWEGGRRAR